MSKYWRGQEATLSVSDVDVGVLQNVEVEFNQDIEELLGAGSRKILDRQKTSFRVNVSGEVLSFAVGDYGTLIDYNSGENGINDTSDVKSFTMTGTFYTTDSTDSDEESIELAVKEVVFESIPIGGDKDEWIGLTLEGEGTDIEITETEPA